MIEKKNIYKWGLISIAFIICFVGLFLLFFRQPTITALGIQRNLMVLFLVEAIVSCFIGCLVKNNKWRIVSLCVVATTLLTWTYYANPFDKANVSFSTFQEDSDTLVYSKLEARNNDVLTGNYGLGRYMDILGAYSTYSYKDATSISVEDGSVTNGYSTVFPGIVVDNNLYNTNTFVIGNQIQFSSGERLPIIDVTTTDVGLFVKVDDTQCLSKETEGDIKDIIVYNAQGEALPTGVFYNYRSSVGAQGFMFSIIEKITNVEFDVIFPLVCSFLFAVVVVCFLFLLQKKYNSLMAISFFFVFWLSPWITNFANSEYWVQFTWLLPSVFGLIISIWQNNKIIRWIGYIGVFLSILLKCLCGYEYLTFVMLGVIFFLLFDMSICIVEKNWKSIKKIFAITVCTGIVALIGFAVALMIHAFLRGNGDIFEGIQNIWQQDVLRRTLGGNPDNFVESYIDSIESSVITGSMEASIVTVLQTYMNNFAEVYRDSMEASIITVLQTYMIFATPIILGVSGNLFSLICLAPILIFVWNAYVKHKVMWEDVILYVISLFSSLSWFVLGKQHSYIHTTMNYVCWYYWFIPVCLYIIVKQLYLLITHKKDI